MGRGSECDTFRDSESCRSHDAGVMACLRQLELAEWNGSEKRAGRSGSPAALQRSGMERFELSESGSECRRCVAANFGAQARSASRRGETENRSGTVCGDSSAGVSLAKSDSCKGENGASDFPARTALAVRVSPARPRAPWTRGQTARVRWGGTFDKGHGS
jgi:hypothetical protein